MWEWACPLPHLFCGCRENFSYPSKPRPFRKFLSTLLIEFHFSQTSIGFWLYSGKQKQCLGPPSPASSSSPASH
ncbi:hypothetical protein EMIT0357P_70265 [Pseudomonas marginalis]